MPRSFLRREPPSPQGPSTGPGGLFRQLVSRAATGPQLSQRSPGRTRGRDYEHTIPIPSEPRPYFPVPQLATPTRGSPLDHWAEVTEFGQIRSAGTTTTTTEAAVQDTHAQAHGRARSQSRPIVISEETLARMRGFRARADSLEIDDWPAEHGTVLGVPDSPTVQTVPSTPTGQAISPENVVPLEDLFQVPTVRLTPQDGSRPREPTGFSDSISASGSTMFGGLLNRGERDMSRSSSGEAIREAAATVAQTTVSVARSMTKKLSVDSLLGRKRSKETKTGGTLVAKHSRLDILGSGRGRYEAMPPTPPTGASPFLTAPLPSVPSGSGGAAPPRAPLPAMRLVRQNRFGLAPASAANAIAHSARPRAMGTLEINSMRAARQIPGSAPVSPFADPPATPTIPTIPLPDVCTPTPKTSLAPPPPPAAIEPDTFRTPVQPRPPAIPSTLTLSADHRCRVPGSTFSVEPGSFCDETPRPRARTQWQARMLPTTTPKLLPPKYSPSDSPQLPRAELLAFLFPSPPPRIPLPPTPTTPKHFVRSLPPARPDDSPLDPQGIKPAHASSPVIARAGSDSSDEAPQAIADADADGDRSFDSIQSTESVQALQVSHQRSMSEMKAAFRRMRGLAHANPEVKHAPGSAAPKSDEQAGNGDEGILARSSTLDNLEASLRTAVRDRSPSPSPPRRLASAADLPTHTPRKSVSSHQFSDARSTVTHTTLHPDDSRSNIAFHQSSTPPLPLPPLRRPRSRASSLGSVARGPNESVLERIERHEGQGWWSTPRRESEVTSSDQSIEQLEYAARSAIAAASPLRQMTPRTMTPLARTSRRLILASGGSHRPMSSGEPFRRTPKIRHVSSPVQHAVGQWRADIDQPTSLPQGTAPASTQFGQPLRVKRSRPRVCSEVIPVLVSSPFGPSTSTPTKTDKGKARAVSSTAVTVHRSDSLTVTQSHSASKTFAREVSPEIARRATQLAQRIESSSSGYTSSSRRAEAELMSTAPTSLEPSSEDEQDTPTKVIKPVTSVGKVRSAVLDLDSIQKKHESEIDTLVTLLSQTREENKGLRQQVDSLQATVSAARTPEAASAIGTPRARQRIASSPVVSPLSRKNLAQLEDLYTPRSRAKTGMTTPRQQSGLRETTTPRMLV